MFNQLIVQPLTQLLLWLNDFYAQFHLPAAISSFSLALISIAVLVKLVTYPLTAQQMKSMRGMQEIQPKLKELQKTYKNDREQLASKQMELYKEHGVNPFGGCLPLLIQMPVLLGLFRAINGLSAQMQGARFFWIDDLAVPEPLPWTDPAGIPLLIIMLVVSQYLYQKYMTPPTASDDPQAAAMASMTKYMPLFFAFIFIRMPAGVVLYYLAFNVVSVVQQVYLNRSLGSMTQTLSVRPEQALELAPEPSAEEVALKETTNVGKRRRRRKA